MRSHRYELGVRPVYKRVDTCAAEFASSTAYMYSTYEEECEAATTDKQKIMVLGGGPNRIGQGIEFDYCCVHAAFAMREDGYETIMVNCNPETVSTDYDTSDRLYFEPLTLEDVLEIVHKENPKGIIVQYGGQTPLKLARDLEAAGVPVIGTTPDCIDLAEDRERFQLMVEKLELLQPPNRVASTAEAALALAEEVLEHWITAKGDVPTDAEREGFRLLALHRQGAKGDPSFNACRETCREVAYHYNLIKLQPDSTEITDRLQMMMMVSNHLYLFINGKMQVAELGEFCCSSKPIRLAPETKTQTTKEA